MTPQPYENLSDEQLLALCIWREARGEMNLGKRAVGCVVRNRVAKQSWMGHDWQSVILKPYQFSSFNAPPRAKITDPNEAKWPEDDEADWLDCLDAAREVIDPTSGDVTNGGLYYYSPPLTAPPTAWGAVVPTASIGHLSFWKPAAPVDLSAGDL